MSHGEYADDFGRLESQLRDIKSLLGRMNSLLTQTREEANKNSLKILDEISKLKG